jgi:subfamily B ATP-binding cassette protein HlyB/CyaB
VSSCDIPVKDLFQCLDWLESQQYLSASGNINKNLKSDETVKSADLSSFLTEKGIEASIILGTLNEACLEFPAIAVFRDGVTAVVIQRRGAFLKVWSGHFNRTAMVRTRDFEKITANIFIVLKSPKTSPSPSVDVSRLQSWLSELVRYHRGAIVEFLILSLVSQGLALAQPLCTQVIVDKVLISGNVLTLYAIIGGLVVIAILDAIVTILRRFVLVHIGNNADLTLSGRLLAHAFNLPMDHFMGKSTGDSVSKIREIETLRSMLSGGLMGAVVDAVLAVVMLGVMMSYDSTLTLIFCLAMPLHGILIVTAAPRIKKLIDRQARLNGDGYAFLVEHFSSIETTKATGRIGSALRLWSEKCKAYIAASSDASKSAVVAGQGVSLITDLSTAALYCFGGLHVIDGSLSMGGLIAFTMISRRASAPYLRLAQSWQTIQQIRISIDRIESISEEAREDENAVNQSVRPASDSSGSIRVEDISFTYPGQRHPVLHELGLSIEPGQVVGFIGPSGCGKSTVARLLQGLLRPDCGRILIGGTDTRYFPIERLRRQVGLVLQENLLFSGTILENITGFAPNGSVRAATLAAKMAGADEFIDRMPKGINSVVSERGTGLSGGQRQRIAIARALYKNPQILIFDEATSALDFESEFAIQRMMPLICKNRTVVIISHRATSIRSANRIICLDKGRLVDDGTPLDLYSRPSYFSELVKAQEFMIAPTQTHAFPFSRGETVPALV